MRDELLVAALAHQLFIKEGHIFGGLPNASAAMEALDQALLLKIIQIAAEREDRNIEGFVQAIDGNALFLLDERKNLISARLNNVTALFHGAHSFFL